MMRKTLITTVALAALALSASACDTLDSSDARVSAKSQHGKQDSKPKSNEAKPVAEKTKDPMAGFTNGQKQAVGAALDYLDYQAFSRQGLIDQLSSEYGSQFKKADAEFAVDHLKVSWNAQAVKAAKDYLDYQHFSKAGLIDQLSSKYGSQFTRAQATYGANHVGL